MYRGNASQKQAKAQVLEIHCLCDFQPAYFSLEWPLLNIHLQKAHTLIDIAFVTSQALFFQASGVLKALVRCP
jgi:hypothetical protein